MKRLVDGAFALIMAHGEKSRVDALDRPLAARIRPEDADALGRLAHGIDDDAPDDPFFLSLAAEGLAERGLPAHDPVIEARLAELGRGFRWHIDHDPRADALVALMRRVHSRRKVFFTHFGQTPVLPEIAALRCLLLVEALGQGARVLHVGDDDLMSLGMAFLGLSPTVVDIDPLLVSFIGRVASDEGLEVAAKVQDCLAPFPQELTAAFDGVFSDPMSYEKCQLAFLSRACSALREGGLLMTTVHPLARDVCARVYAQLPVERVAAHAERSVYYYLRYEPSPYRSDLVLLRRTAGEPPWRPPNQIPYDHVTDGELAERQHAILEVRGIRSRGAMQLEEIRRALSERAGVPASAVRGVVGEKAGHAFAAIEGGHASLSVDLQRNAISASMFPATWPRTDAMHHALGALVKPLKKQTLMVPALRFPPRPLSRPEQTEARRAGSAAAPTTAPASSRPRR